jgi:antitoxin-like ribbon-helix-helix protein
MARLPSLDDAMKRPATPPQDTNMQTGNRETAQAGNRESAQTGNGAITQAGNDATVPSRTRATRTPARQNKRGVAFWLNPDAFRQLRALTFEEERSVQSLMEEAVDLLFQNRGKHRLARGGQGG